MTNPSRSEYEKTDFQWLQHHLRNRSFYPHHPKKLQFVQTHGSLVVIAKPYVYKIKKPVDFGFMDYSTLALRKLNLDRELSYNEQLAPGVYLEVKPLYVNSGKLSWTDGELVEWVLVMRYLPHKWFLDQRIQRGDIDSRHIDQIGQILSKFYSQPVNQSSNKGSIAYLRTAIRNNFRFTKPFADDLVPGFVHASLRHHAQLGFLKLRGILNNRMQHAWRWCHGDLHLDHIHVKPKAIRIYDCIEFNDGLRWIDMANDLAFLAMDLDYYRRSDLARHLIRKASSQLNDATMPQVVDFYKTYRAMVRAKVESLQVYSSGAAEKDIENNEKRRRAESYFRLALDYAVTGRCPLVIVVMGRIGTGKSTVAKKLSECLGCAHINSDEVRKTLAGIPLTQQTDRAQRRTLYASSMTRKVYASMRQMAMDAVDRDQSVVLDATYRTAAERRRLKQVCKKEGISIRWVEMIASDATIKRRLKQRDREMDVISDARLSDFETLTRKYVSPKSGESASMLSISSHGQLDATLKRVLIGLIDQQMDHVLRSK